VKKILLVEDTADLAEEIVDVLQLSGYEVQWASGGIKAIEMLKAYPADLVITDLLMPGMDGYQLILALRSMAPFKTLPIIILSAKTAPSDRLKGTEVGANGFVGKPCKAHELISAIEPFVGKGEF
jgi:DNA-binding response OmpR family regulator